MPTYRYTGFDALGQPASGTITSLSETVARYTLGEEHRVTVTTLRPSMLSREWGSAKPKRGSVLLFTRMTSSLLRSLTLMQALEVTRGDLDDTRMERILADVSVRVRRGSSLADALADHPHAFDPAYVAAVRAGERANLQDVMRMLTISQRQNEETRRKVAKGLAYPTTVLGIGILVTLVILYVVVPRFARAVAEAGAGAPIIMRMMLGVSEILRLLGPLLVIAVAAGAWLAVRAYRRNERFRRGVDGAMLRLPVLGTLIGQAAIAVWARLFAILYSSGTPVSSAVTLAAQAVGNHVLRAALVSVAIGHANGPPLWQEMRRVGIPPIAVKMTQVGEEGGRLADMMNELAEYYEEETSYSVHKLTSKLESIAIVVIMVPIALLVGGVYALMASSIQAVTGQ
jgi:type IV pilus assembly protein PilC